MDGYAVLDTVILYPQTEEIGLERITNAKISNMFSRESPYISNMFSREPPTFHTSFHACKWSPRLSKDLTRKSLDLEIQIFCKSDLASEKIGDSPIKSEMKLGPQTHFGAKSQSERTIQLVPEPRKMSIIIPRRRRGTWEGVTVAIWCRE